MKGILMYHPTGCAPPILGFIDSLDKKLREKLLVQMIRLSSISRTELKEPHFKHFSIEKYRSLYELREKSKVLVRVIFTFTPDGSVLLLHGFIKRQGRDTMRALEQSLQILAQIRECPDCAVEFKMKKEEPK